MFWNFYSRRASLVIIAWLMIPEALRAPSPGGFRHIPGAPTLIASTTI